MVKPIAIPPPSARRSRGEPAVARLRREILLGRHRPGDRLPPERELAARLGTNRNTLREAMRILESENLVRARQGDGTIVLDWRASGELTLLPAFLAEETPAMERYREVLTLLHLRERLLDEALGLAAAGGAAGDFAAVQEAINELAHARPGPEVARADVEVFRRVVAASHSLVVVWVFNTFAKIFVELGERLPHLWTNEPKYLDALSRILHWLEQRRPDRAREELRDLFAARAVSIGELLRPIAGLAEPRRPRTRKGGRA